jgi:hypothetical protein
MYDNCNEILKYLFLSPKLNVLKVCIVQGMSDMHVMLAVFCTIPVTYIFIFSLLFILFSVLLTAVACYHKYFFTTSYN